MLHRPIRFAGFDLVILALTACIAMIAPGARSQSTSAPSSPAKSFAIVLLGTGTPVPNADRQGPSLAVVANGKAYIVDAGSGVTRKANSAFQRGITALRPATLDIAFLAHLHSDHTLGLPGLILTPWIQERTKPLQLYGPTGIKAMAGHILEAFAEDIQARTTGLECGKTTGYKVEAHEVGAGTIYQDENVTVKAFLVKHGSWKEALGYRFDAGGRSVVVSGDTSPAESVIDACNGCDALIHEVYSGRGVNPTKASLSVEQWMKYESQFHTSATELGEIAAKAKAKMLVLTHWTLLGDAKEDDMVRAIREKYTGPIIVGRDLDVIVP